MAASVEDGRIHSSAAAGEGRQGRATRQRSGSPSSRRLPRAIEVDRRTPRGARGFRRSRWASSMLDDTVLDVQSRNQNAQVRSLMLALPGRTAARRSTHGRVGFVPTPPALLTRRNARPVQATKQRLREAHAPAVRECSRWSRASPGGRPARAGDSHSEKEGDTGEPMGSARASEPAAKPPRAVRRLRGASASRPARAASSGSGSRSGGCAHG